MKTRILLLLLAVSVSNVDKGQVWDIGNMYPNPLIGDSLTVPIPVGGSEFYIYNSVAVEMYSEVFLPADSAIVRRISIDRRVYQNGCYFVMIKVKNRNLCQRLLINR